MLTFSIIQIIGQEIVISKNWLFGATNVAKSDKDKYVNSGYGKAFNGAGQ